MNILKSTIVLSAFALTFCPTIEVRCLTPGGNKVYEVSQEVWYRDATEHARQIERDMSNACNEYYFKGKPQYDFVQHTRVSRSLFQKIARYIEPGLSVDVFKVLETRNRSLYYDFTPTDEPVRLTNFRETEAYLARRIDAWYQDPDRLDILQLTFNCVFHDRGHPPFRVLYPPFAVQRSDGRFLGIYSRYVHIDIGMLNLDQDEIADLVGPCRRVDIDKTKAGNIATITDYVTRYKALSAEQLAEFMAVNASE